jgi:myo-inositol 2-dehydrogenase/D-chiro-inositol 1-dehydrogenase
MSSQPHPSSRRTFLKQSSALVAGTSILSSATRAQAGAHGDEVIRVALIGCGGRGTGAAGQALSTEGKVQIVAMADAFDDRLESSLKTLKEHHPDKVMVADEHKFVGFDAYEKAIALDVDMVILATPPGFRPIHFEHAVAQGKHVFMEKPVAVDGPGIRKVLEAAKVAKEKNLKVGVGLQRHHELKYKETIKRIQDGAIGDIIMMRCYWNSAGVWVRERQEGMTEMEYQMRNWYYFNWLCGDHIVEQHIHNLDVCNWIKNDFPTEAHGQGGRQVRTGLDTGEIFDHHMIEYTYDDGTKMISQCRHVPGAWSSVSEHVHGTLGTADVSRGRIKGAGGWSWRFEDDNPNPYQVEHDDLFAAIRADTPYNEAEYGARSTMTAIHGRMATYSGKLVTLDEALNSELALVPDSYAWNANPPSMPDSSGRYPIPRPGETQAL